MDKKITDRAYMEILAKARRAHELAEMCKQGYDLFREYYKAYDEFKVAADKYLK